MLCPQRAHTIAHSGTDTRPLSVDNSSKRLSICLFVPLSCGSGSGFGYGFGARSCANSPEALKKKRQRKKNAKGFIVLCSPAALEDECVCELYVCVCVCCMYAVCVCVSFVQQLCRHCESDSTMSQVICDSIHKKVY